MGSYYNNQDTWPAKILIAWRSWTDYGPINRIAVLSWEGDEVFSFNPEDYGMGYEGAAIVTINGVERVG